MLVLVFIIFWDFYSANVPHMYYLHVLCKANPNPNPVLNYRHTGFEGFLGIIIKWIDWPVKKFHVCIFGVLKNIDC